MANRRRLRSSATLGEIDVSPDFASIHSAAPVAGSGRIAGAIRSRTWQEDDTPATPMKRLRRMGSDAVPPKDSGSAAAAPEMQQCGQQPEEAKSSTDTALGYPMAGREPECQRLDAFLKASLAARGSRGGALYVSGGPGTGKTCCTRAASNAWRRRHPETHVMEVNCFDLKQRSVAGLFQHLAGPSGAGRVGQKLRLAAAEQLARLGPSVIVIVDEADQLVSRQPSHAATALEALLSLPRLPGAPAVALVAIANAVDLLLRSAVPLPSGLCSSLLFEPYGIDQLRGIARARLSAAGSAGARATSDLGKVNLEVCARRLASRSGDCRQLVRLCEQAVKQARASEAQEAAEGLSGPTGEPATPVKVARPQTMPGLREAQVDPLRSVPELPMEQQVLLCALAGSKSEAVRFLDICARYRELCGRLKQPANLASKECVRGALVALEQRGLLALRERKVGGRGGGLGRPAGRGSGPSGGAIGGESIAELAVAREKIRERLTEANALLAKCLE